MKAFLALLALLQSAGVLVNRMSIPAQMVLTLMPRRSVDAQFFLALANLIEKACIFHRDYCLGAENFRAARSPCQRTVGPRGDSRPRCLSATSCCQRLNLPKPSVTIRDHWHIVNRSHYVHDGSFAEDASSSP